MAFGFDSIFMQPQLEVVIAIFTSFSGAVYLRRGLVMFGEDGVGK